MADYIIPDISHHTGDIDWAGLKNSTPFLIFKGTQRTDFVSPMLEIFIQRCEERKIPYWIFAYLEKGNERTQTEFLTRTCKRIIGDYFVGYAIDCEEKNNLDDVLKSMEVIYSAGFKGMFYGPYNTWKRVSKDFSASDFVFWEARYGKNNGTYSKLYPPHKVCSLHQYTENGVVPYIKGTVDLNRLTGVTDLEWFLKKKGAISTPTPASSSDNPINGKIITLPNRGYYKVGDGYLWNRDLKDDIKLLQTLCNWILEADYPLVIDGKYGKKTRSSVELMQCFIGVKADGLFGVKTLEAAIKYVKEK